MQRLILEKKPLVEAVFELQWELVKEEDPSLEVDPDYPILIGRMYDRLSNEYPARVKLESANIPVDFAGHIAQHQFRKTAYKWPLVQLGPGIMTVNDTEDYRWEDFRERITSVVRALFESYPQAEDGSNRLNVSLSRLRYVNRIFFDYKKDRILDFLREQMQIGVDLPARLFQDSGVSDSPEHFNLDFGFSSSRPPGAIALRFSRGQVDGQDVVLWNTQVTSVKSDAPSGLEAIAAWVDEAYHLTHDWFYKIIEGKLLESFEPWKP